MSSLSEPHVVVQIHGVNEANASMEEYAIEPFINCQCLEVQVRGEIRLKTKTFDNVKNQIGFCGIWCGSCVAGNGALKELTERYEEVVRKYGLKEWAPKDFDFQEFAKGLESIQAMPLCLGCLKGGGRSNCEMRNCASNKKINDCSECNQPDACKNLETLQKMRTGALDAGLFVKTQNVDRQKLIDKWTDELKGKWPHCIVLCGCS